MSQQSISPLEYRELLISLKQRVQEAQFRASFAVNSELVLMYWEIGQAIVEKQEQYEWGSQFLKRLSEDLQREFPDIKGFSRRNLYRMRMLYISYREDPEFVPQAVAQIPWGHNILILEKIKDVEQRKWYIQQTTENGWSRNILKMQIESDLFQRKGKAITNFSQTLPPIQSELAEQALKDPYIFDFLVLTERAKERELEQGLIKHIREFLLEMGEGFAFVGNQVQIEVDEHEYFIDLLFYHLKLRSYIVIELKAREFRPEDAGKMNFYLSAVDDLMCHPDDSRSIGLILCKTNKGITAEYALRDIGKPISISGWKTRITEELPKNLQSSLPTIEEIEEELEERIEKGKDKKEEKHQT